MTKAASRKMTLNERIYTIAEKLAPPFVLQFVIEGNGQIEAEHMRKAIDQLAEKLPMMRLKLSGRTWDFDGPLPEVIEHDKEIPNDFSDSIFRAPLDPFTGRGMEVHLFQGKKTTVLFRILHSIVDGKGAQIVLESLFSLMRNEEIHINPGFVSDIEVREKLATPQHGEREGYAMKWPGFPLSKDNQVGFVSRTIRFDKRIESPLAKCAVWFANRFGETTRMLIPVDIRRHEGVENMTANLSLPIYLTIEPGQEWWDVQGDLLEALAENKELAAESMERFGLLAPDFILENLMKFVIKRVARKITYPMSGILSDMGIWDLAKVSTLDFTANDLITVPVFVPMAPFSVDLFHHSGGTRIGVSIPENEDIDALMKEMKSFILEAKPVDQPLSEAEIIDDQLSQELREIWAKILERNISEIDIEATFHQLGGDSIKLLFMLSEVSDQYIKDADSSFMGEALQTGGHISIQSLLKIMA